MDKKIEEDVFIADGAVVVGDVTIGKGSSVWFNATVRGDSPVRIGTCSNIQDNSVVHVDVGMEVVVGDYVTVGHSCILHGCRIEDNTLIGMGSIIMNNAHIGKNCIIGAGTLVTEGKEVPDGCLYLGRPGKVIRSLTPEEIARNHSSAEFYVREAAAYKKQADKDLQ